MTLAAPEEIDLVNLDHAIANYNSETDRCLLAELPDLEERLWAKIPTYDRLDGNNVSLCDYLHRLALNGAAFLKHLGFDAKAADNFYHAMLFSKLGLIHDNNNHKGFAPADPVCVADRQEARQLADDGCEILNDAMASMSQEFRDHPHIRLVMPALMQFHNECVNGRGPFACDGRDMGVIIRVAAIVDAYQHQYCNTEAAHAPGSPIEAIERMCGHDETDNCITYNSFDRRLLEAYAHYQSHGSQTGTTRNAVREMAIETA